jgi:hypothetical protein
MYAGSTFVYLGRWLIAAMLYTPGANLASRCSRILLAQFVALCIFGTSLSRPKTLTDTSTAQANKVPQIWSVPWNEPSAMACSSQFASNISKPLTMSGCPIDLNPSPEELLFSFPFFFFLP